MNIFDSYTNRVKSTLQQDKINRSMTESYKTFSTGTTLVKARAASIDAIRRDLQPESSLLTLARIVRACDLSAAKVGQHPDFCHLIGTEETEMHYITSAFIDIKGSTRLHDSYELDTFRLTLQQYNPERSDPCLPAVRRPYPADTGGRNLRVLRRQIR